MFGVIYVTEEYGYKLIKPVQVIEPAKDFDGDSTYIWKVTESRGS